MRSERALVLYRSDINRLMLPMVGHSQHESWGTGTCLRSVLLKRGCLRAICSPRGSQEALKSMVFSGPDSTLRLQELPRRVPDPQLVRLNGSDVQRKIRRLLFFSTRRRLMRHAAREPRAATHRSRDHVGRSGRSWAFRISTSHARSAATIARWHPCRRG